VNDDYDMRRRAALVTVGTLALAGCSRTATPEFGPVAEAFDDGPTRPECDVGSEPIEVEVGGESREFETAATIPYPDPPDRFGERDIREYVVAFEEAYVTHDAVCDRDGSARILSVTFSTEQTETFDRGANAWLAYLRYAGGASSGVDDGGLWEADLGYSQVIYAVDETGAARVVFDEPRDPSRDEVIDEAPDPVAEVARWCLANEDRRTIEHVKSEYLSERQAPREQEQLPDRIRKAHRRGRLVEVVLRGERTGHRVSVGNRDRESVVTVSAAIELF
jgi:hypothetical protein